MGSFAGHAVPGSFFLVYGIWWIFASYWYYFYNKPTNSRVSKSKLKRENELIRRSTLPTPCCPRLPLESICKVILPLCGVLVETLFNWDDGVVFDPIEVHNVEDFSRMQHTTMYSFFLLSGIIDLCVYCVRFPKNCSKLFLVIAFVIEGMLFYFHTEHRDMLNQRSHFILTLCIFGCAICAAIRMYCVDNLQLNAGLGFFITLQGTWFYQVAIVLYGKNSKSWLEDEMSPMYMGFALAWHVLIITILMLLSWVLMAQIIKNSTFQKLTSFQRQQDIFIKPLLDSDDTSATLLTAKRKNTNEGNAETVI